MKLADSTPFTTQKYSRCQMPGGCIEEVGRRGTGLWYHAFLLCASEAPLRTEGMHLNLACSRLRPGYSAGAVLPTPPARAALGGQ